MLFTKIKNLVKKILGRDNPSVPTHQAVSYPYVYHEEEYNIFFNINNQIEDFRLKNWGGEKEYVTDMLKDIRPDDIFFDIGSSVGLISVMAAKFLTNGKVISFEPDPENAAKLIKNFSANHLTNYSVQQIGVGEKKDTMKLYTAGSNGYSPSLQKVNGIENTIDVEINSIDNLIDNNSIPYPTIVKIDIEGAEMMALQGMRKLLSGPNRPRIIFIELHPDFLPSFNTSAPEIFEYFANFEYNLEENITREKQILCKLVRS